MTTRCYDVNHPAYTGKLEVCAEWMDSFETFAVWSYKHGYVDGAKWMKLKRIHKDKGFSPDNCKWTKARVITYNGQTHTLKEWSDITGVSLTTINSRLKRGLQPQHIFLKERITAKLLESKS